MQIHVDRKEIETATKWKLPAKFVKIQMNRKEQNNHMKTDTVTQRQRAAVLHSITCQCYSIFTQGPDFQKSLKNHQIGIKVNGFPIKTLDMQSIRLICTTILKVQVHDK